MKKVRLYTDGSCSDNQRGKDNKGGWAFVLLYEKDGVAHTKELNGCELQTTNNRMEMLAVIKGLECLKEPCEVELLSDSALLINCFLDKWYVRWLDNGWINSRGKPVENKELWEQLLQLANIHTINFVKVKGHAEDIYNNRCDELAQSAWRGGGIS